MATLLYKHGNILHTEQDVIAHGVSIGDPMDKGLSLEIRENLPDVLEEFTAYCNEHIVHTGEVVPVRFGETRTMLNLVTKESMDDTSTEDSLKESFTRALMWTTDHGFDGIAVPLIGTESGLSLGTSARIIETTALKFPHITVELWVGNSADNSVNTVALQTV